MIDLNKILAMRRELVADGTTNSKGGPSCGTLAEWLAVEFGWQEFYGYIYDQQGLVIDEDHAWAILPDGTIIDASIDQFSGTIDAWPGLPWVAIVPPGHPYQKRYETQ